MFGLPCYVFSVSHMIQQADQRDSGMDFGNGRTICTLGAEKNLAGISRKKKMKRIRRRRQLSERNEGSFLLPPLCLQNT